MLNANGFDVLREFVADMHYTKDEVVIAKTKEKKDFAILKTREVNNALNKWVTDKYPFVTDEVRHYKRHHKVRWVCDYINYLTKGSWGFATNYTRCYYCNDVIHIVPTYFKNREYVQKEDHCICCSCEQKEKTISILFGLQSITVVDRRGRSRLISDSMR